jgi:2-polyprenyl-3-methyl-5-hydroxy-6-metoxy-1,4-benzoquinol methylase
VTTKLTRASSDFIAKNKAYFEREAEDFDAIQQDPNRVKDPFRRFVYRYFLRLHEEDKRLTATLAIARRHAPSWAGREVLELGCGPGLYSIAFARLGARVTMLDYSKPMLDIARRNIAAAGVEASMSLVEGDVRTYDPRRRFDLVFLTGVTDYLPKSSLPDIAATLERTAKGLVIMSFPTRYSFLSWVRWVWLIGFKRIALQYFVWRDIEQFAAAHGFTIADRHVVPGYYVVGLTRPEPAR